MLAFGRLVLCAAITIWVAIAIPARADEPAPDIALFATRDEAKAHCPADIVIEITLPEGFYLHGDRGFGGASLGRVFVCRSEILGAAAARR